MKVFYFKKNGKCNSLTTILLVVLLSVAGLANAQTAIHEVYINGFTAPV